MKQITIKLFNYNELNEEAQDIVEYEFFKDENEEMFWWEYIKGMESGVFIQDQKVLEAIEELGLFSQNKWEDKETNMVVGTYSYWDILKFMDEKSCGKELYEALEGILDEFVERYQFSKYNEDIEEYFDTLIQEEWYQFLEDGTRYYGDEESEEN